MIAADRIEKKMPNNFPWTPGIISQVWLDQPYTKTK